jgi:hypothetical protein
VTYSETLPIWPGIMEAEAGQIVEVKERRM